METATEGGGIGLGLVVPDCSVGFNAALLKGYSNLVPVSENDFYTRQLLTRG
jgi:hypothetical protein